MTSPRDFTSPDDFSDVTLHVEDTLLYVHRETLATWVGAWRTQLVSESACAQDGRTELHVTDRKLEEIVELLRAIYPEQRAVSDENVNSFLELSEELDIPHLRTRCEEFLCAQEPSIALLQVAERYGLKNLLKQEIDHAKTRTLEELERDPQCRLLQPSTLARIYREKALAMRDYANELKISENTLQRRTEQLENERDAMVTMFSNVSNIWETPNKRCYKHMTEERYDYTCRDCNERIQREVRRMCSDAKHVRRYFPLNNKLT